MPSFSQAFLECRRTHRTSCNKPLPSVCQLYTCFEFVLTDSSSPRMSDDASSLWIEAAAHPRCSRLAPLMLRSGTTCHLNLEGSVKSSRWGSTCLRPRIDSQKKALHGNHLWYTLRTLSRCITILQGKASTVHNTDIRQGIGSSEDGYQLTSFNRL